MENSSLAGNIYGLWSHSVLSLRLDIFTPF